MDLFNKEDRYNKYIQIRNRNVVLFICISIFTCLAISLLILFSYLSYYLNLIISIILLISYLMYLVFYCSVIHKENNAYLRLYKGCNSNNISEYKGKIISIGDSFEIYNDIDCYPIIIETIENYKNVNKKIYCLNNNIEIKSKSNLIFKTYNQVVFSIEEDK